MAQGSLGAGVALLEAPGVAEPDGVGSAVPEGAAAGPAAFWFAPAVGDVLPIGNGSEDEVGVAADDGLLDADGDALASRPQTALVTGSDDGDALDVGVALPDGNGNGDALLEGRSDGLGPLPPSANAVAATDATMAAVAAPNATERRVIGTYTSVPIALPGLRGQKRTFRAEQPYELGVTSHSATPSYDDRTGHQQSRDRGQRGVGELREARLEVRMCGRAVTTGQ